MMKMESKRKKTNKCNRMQKVKERN